MNTKFIIKIDHIKDIYQMEKEEKYYYRMRQYCNEKYVVSSDIEIAKKFKTAKNAKTHLQKIIKECVNINSRSGFTIIEIDEKCNIISEEKVNVQKLSEELSTKNPQYKSIEYYVDKLNKVMSRLHVINYEYNWDKDSAYIKFTYKGEFYKFDHKATSENKLTYGTDCLAQLVLTLEDLARMSGLSNELEKMIEQYDLSEISMIKQEVEELMLNADGTQRTTKIEDYRSGKIPL